MSGEIFRLVFNNLKFPHPPFSKSCVRYCSSLIGLLIIAARNLQRFSDRSFVCAFELIFILNLIRL